MKKSCLLFFFAMLLSIFSFAQDNIYYTVQVGTFLDASPKDFEHVRSLGFLHIRKLAANHTDVFMGGYESREAAQEIVNQLAQKGFVNAYVKENFLDEGNTVSVIQVATTTPQKVNWEKYQNVGKVHILLKPNQLKVVTGIYANLDDARRDLPRVKSLGYKDAFIKNVNSIFLHELSEYATGIKKALIPLALDEKSMNNPSNPSNNTNTKGVPESFDNPSSPAPPTYDVPVFNNPTPRPTTVKNKVENAIPLPNIRVRVKRKSVVALQNVLKAEKTYTSGVDGYYGKGTKAGYEKAIAKNQIVQKYLTLFETGGTTTLPTSNDHIQDAINAVVDDPSAQTVLERSGLPLAKAYEAYMLYSTVGPGVEVNSLMNEAIRGTYANKKYVKRPPFDFTATYAYEDIDQLVLHLFYLHAAPDSKYSAPCWLFDLHPGASSQAFETVGSLSNGEFKLQSCDLFLQWDELKLTQAIASDLNSDRTMDTERLAQDATKRARLFLAPKALDSKMSKEIAKWNTDLWSALNSWSTKDPLHENMVTSLKIVYFQSYVRLEDYFMDKGFKASQAKSLAELTLETMVGYHLDRFTNF